MSSNLIVFYDIPSTLPGSAWSPNTWKIRYALNYKGLPYKTVWVEFPDISELSIKLGIPPARISSKGIPFYTVPIIHDPSTGTTVSDSIRIAQYLDATYPDTPRLIPEGTQALQHAFVSAFAPTLPPLVQLTPFRTFIILNLASKPFFRRTREERYHMRLEDILPTQEEREAKWRVVERAFGVVDEWSRLGGLEGPFVMGQTVTFSDFEVAGWLMWIRKLWGDDSEEWQRMAGWHGRRWDALMRFFEQHSQTETQVRKSRL